MPEELDGSAAHDGAANDPDGLHRCVHSAVSLQEAIKHLGYWFATLRAPPYTQFNPDERFLMAFASDVDHPVKWCAARSLCLSLDIKTSLAAATYTENSVASLDPLTCYVLGRAAMRCIADAPTGSSGLSLAYELLWPLMRSREAVAGSDDELAAAAGPATEARGEVEAEARRLRADPVTAARRFNVGTISEALMAAARPVSLEACSHSTVRKISLDFPFGRIVRTLASDDAKFGARLIAMVSNPLLVAAVLGGGLADLDAVRSGSFLRSLPSIFDAEGRWTGETTAWMVVLHIEDGLVEILDRQLRAVRSGGASPQDPSAVVAAELLGSADAILARTDGPRLALEWLAHLIWSAILDANTLRQGGNGEFAPLTPRIILLNVLATRLEREDWTNPIRIWSLFSGGSVVAGIERGEVPKAGADPPLPIWRDWLGQANPVVPIAVAVQLLQASDPVPALVPAWIKLLFRDLDETPARQLAEAGPNQAASYLAWPLTRSGQAARAFAALWSDASWLRVSARFARIEEAAAAARPCVALLRVGLRMLEFSAAGDTGCHELASMLTDAVDEVRYTFPEIGLLEWSSLAGSLAGIMAGRGLLEGAAVGELLARYQGDDAALAAAMVNMAANGIQAVNICRALAFLGEDVGRLIRRWETWNERLARDKQGEPSAFLARLIEITAV